MANDYCGIFLIFFLFDLRLNFCNSGCINAKLLIRLGICVYFTRNYRQFRWHCASGVLYLCIHSRLFFFIRGNNGSCENKRINL